MINSIFKTEFQSTSMLGRPKTKILISLLQLFIFYFSLSIPGFAVVDSLKYITTEAEEGTFTVASNGRVAPLMISKDDYPGVIKAGQNLRNDLHLATGIEPSFFLDRHTKEKQVIIAGTIGKSPLIEKLIKSKKIDVASIRGKWETFLVQHVNKPFPGIERALVITGSDKRGTIFGIYDLSAQIGVSPWYWWADVPVETKKELFAKPGIYTLGEPKVKYRGIFINDEAPALSGWSKEKFGGFNHKFYEKVFELILRMKGNYLWPAMWGNAIYDDDSLSPKLADELGVVIGTSHHEPMMRAHDEWRRYGKGKWNYQTNDRELREFWRAGIKRMKSNESIVTIGMRGDGDEPMSEGTQISLLEKIVEDQRKIISEVTGKPASETPQMWALYKEVQDYYDKGMRVPDDVTLLLCDDNWGNIRKLPRQNEKARSGGYGIYYHYDYVGGPRNYKWLNTNQIERTWEQMNLAYEYGADKLWLVNVGDIKPMEFPIEFFLDFAWNPKHWPAKKLPEYYTLWSKAQFGEKYAKQIGEIISKYTKYNSRRKPELLSADTYSLTNYNEWERVLEEFKAIEREAEEIGKLLPARYNDAYFQLVLFPVKASSNLNELYFAVAKNHLYAKQGRSETNEWAEKAKVLFARDAELTDFYNNKLANGKWSHMMDQTHIGYTYWQQPEKNTTPETTNILLKPGSEMGIAIEGSDSWWPFDQSHAFLPELNSAKQSTWIEIFNRGTTVFDYEIVNDKEWIKVGDPKSSVRTQKRIAIEVDWKTAPPGQNTAQLLVKGPNKTTVALHIKINQSSDSAERGSFIESNGYISIDASHFTDSFEATGFKWNMIPNLGKTSSAMQLSPVNHNHLEPNHETPYLAYKVFFSKAADVKINAYFSPTIDFSNTGLKYAIAVDDEPPQILDLIQEKGNGAWEKSVANNIKIMSSNHKINSPGNHTLKFWCLDPGVVLQKIVVDSGGLKDSYLGPEESKHPNK